MKREYLQKLIKNYYLGLISKAEENELFEEVESNSDARALFNSYEEEFIATHLNSHLLDSEWNKYSNRYLNKTRIFKSHIIQKGLRYAAVVLWAVLLAGGYLFVDMWINSKQPIQWYETYVPKGEKSTITLPDGTKVWLNSETTLRYPAERYSENRTLQISGEGYFEVAKVEDSPFVVQTKNYDVVVKGTSFNVMAYDDFDCTETALLNGRVEIHNMQHQSSGKMLVLEPGQKVIYNSDLQKYSVHSTDVESEAAWKDNLFVFKDVEFEELCRRLERWYNVEITIVDNDLCKVKYTGSFKNEETIWQVLDIIKITTPIRYELKDRKLTIYKD